MLLLSLATVGLVLTTSSAAPTGSQTQTSAVPQVSTPLGIITGKLSQFDHNVEKFYGIPFALPPVGQLRFAPPVAVTKPFGTFDASTWGYACPQMNIIDGVLPPEVGLFAEQIVNVIEKLPILSDIASSNSSEDCLTINVVRPAGTLPGAKLPVMFWIYGGAFLIGSSNTYDATPLVQKSIDQNTPMIFVSANHRINSFGFLPGRQVRDDPTTSVNAGLLDQRLAMRWIQANIASFGGDPTKVTLVGESSGAISIGFQMLMNGGNNEGLFRAAIMESGAPVPVENELRGQHSFDIIANATGCYNVPDAIACLRAVSYDKLLAATNLLPNILAYQSASLVFIPRTDGKILTAQAQDLIAAGAYSKIPIISGNNADEGTLLTLGTLAIKTDDQLRTWLSTNWFPNATGQQISTIMDLYPQDPTQGSPYDTGYLNILTPQNKRISSMIGDAVFQTGRRAFISKLSTTQPVWSYLYRGLRGLPILGSCHLSEILSVFGYLPTRPSAEMQSRWISFVTTLDPNTNSNGSQIVWPAYDSSVGIIQFNDDGPSTLISDDYRKDPIAYWTSIASTLAL